MINILKRVNRTLLEIDTGILCWGGICQLVGFFLVKEQQTYAMSLWFGILFALTNTLQMYRSLERALDHGEKTAAKIIRRSYLLRYGAVVVILGIIMVTEVMNALVVFLAYMGMKVAAFLQPFTHKLYNQLFHETDPIPQALPEEPEQKINE